MIESGSPADRKFARNFLAGFIGDIGDSALHRKHRLQRSPN
jgi:hypothetical protein